jgi:hypothetical protein
LNPEQRRVFQLVVNKRNTGFEESVVKGTTFEDSINNFLEEFKKQSKSSASECLLFSVSAAPSTNGGS